LPTKFKPRSRKHQSNQKRKCETKWKEGYLATPRVSIGVTECSVENLDSDLSTLRRSHLNVLDGQWLVGFPGHRGFKMKLTVWIN